MERYHADLDKQVFRKLEKGQDPTGSWKYCSNWQEIWNEDFVAKDAEFKKEN